jgi:hypothetical protein
MPESLRPNGWSPGSAKKSPRPVMMAAFLIKLAKHMAVLGCLMIVGTATGRTILGSFSIFLFIVGAVLVHRVGCALERRAAGLSHLPRSGP